MCAKVCPCHGLARAAGVAERFFAGLPLPWRPEMQLPGVDKTPKPGYSLHFKWNRNLWLWALRSREAIFPIGQIVQNA